MFAALPTSRPDVLEGAVIGHWTSVLPPLLTVWVALCFHSLAGALIIGFVSGCLLAFWPDVWIAVPLGAREFIWVNLTEQFNLYIFGFLFALVGMIHVTYRAGGIHGLIHWMARVARGPRSTKVATALAGLAIFFDDYSNTIVVGSTMRRLTDRWKISREKLAYLVDSTTAPVAGLALLSTWIAFEVFLFGDAAARIGIPQGGYGIFLAILPFRFYCWGTLVVVFMSSALGRDYGPMYRAECRAALEGKVLADGAHPLASGGDVEAEPLPGKPQRGWNALIPLAVVVLGTLASIVGLGRHKLLVAGGDFSFWSLADWRDAFGMVTNPDVTPGGAMKVLFWASVAGGVTAVWLACGQRILTLRQAGRAYLRAIPTLWMAFFILIMAWGMSKICTDGVHTDTYLVSLLGDRMPLVLLPLLVFAVASGMSFATGTSFGTMAMLIPIIFTLAHALGAYATDGHLIFWLCAAAVLDGSILGDHCSPISDTTVLSSISSGCDHIDHVATQIPYALTVLLLAGVLGYGAVALGMSGWLFFVLQPVAVALILLIAGRRVPVPVGPLDHS